MAQQRVHRFRLDKPVPYEGRRRVKKKKRIDPRTVPEGWDTAMRNRYAHRRAS